ncbi:hypothetical protein BDSB_11415 [Burkholderia dolosa PC543]|nr:hypothetical protein BDSB_11415 [Burkholderia dolosa PC543]
MRRRSGGTSSDGVATGMPSSTMRPARTGSKPAIARSTVVLPQPDAPSRQPMSPRGSVRLKPSTTVRRPCGVS